MKTKAEFVLIALIAALAILTSLGGYLDRFFRG